eukprot:7515674-Alexandrium_andersonii.AAC.1
MLRFRRPHPIVHQLSKFVAVLAARLAEKALVGGPAVVAHRMLRKQFPRMLHQPEHGGVVDRYLPLDSCLERKHQ